jgi:hypothetical protein
MQNNKKFLFLFFLFLNQSKIDKISLFILILGYYNYHYQIIYRYSGVTKKLESQCL